MVSGCPRAAPGVGKYPVVSPGRTEPGVVKKPLSPTIFEPGVSKKPLLPVCPGVAK